MDLTPSDTPAPTPSPLPEQTPPAPAPAPVTPASMPNPAPVEPASVPAPSQIETVPNPAPNPALKPSATPLTPEEKARLRKLSMKRLAIVGAASYVGLILLIVAWTFTLGGSKIGIFNYLPFSQGVWNALLMKILNIQMGILVCAAFLTFLVGLVKAMLTKKEEEMKKKKASRLALGGGIALFVLTGLWLTALAFVAPILTPQVQFASPILTTPSETLGLTSPVEITFDASEIPVDESVYRIVAYSWNFGDGSTGNGKTLSHTYTQKAKGSGIYTVTLTVQYMDLKTGKSFQDEYKTEVSIANEKTAAYFTMNPAGGEVPLKVTFDATQSYDPDGEIVDYAWDMNGDGKFDEVTGEVAEWTFDKEGDYDVTLRVTDNSGQYSTVTHTVEAGTLNGLRAVISSNVGAEGRYYTKKAIEFTGELSQVRDGKITKYTWDFGDGSKPIQSRSATHTFEKKGDFKVKLSIQDQSGNTDETMLDVHVIEEGAPPTAKIASTPALVDQTVSGAVPLIVGFSGSASTDPDNDIVDYEWDFDNDGTVDATGDSVSHTYEELGTYQARLITVDSVGNTDEALVTVVATEQGIVARLAIDVAAGEVPLTVKFDASASTFKEGHIVSYEYDFGDGSAPHTGNASVTYRYTQTGTFTAKVTVFGDNGKSSSTSVQIVVRPVEMSACFTVNTDSGAAPLFVSVDPSCSEGTIATYQWDFGDGDKSFDRKPETHIYSKPGTYSVTLEVTSSDGLVDTFANTITVR